MTRAVRGYGDSPMPMPMEETDSVSSDVNFASGKFPEYKIGPNNIIIEPEDKPERIASLKEVVAKETSQLLKQQRRLSVRDIAKRFEDSLNVASTFDEAKWKEVSSLDRQVLLKKLRDILYTLRGHVSGKSKEEAEEAITLLEALAVQMTHRDGELLQEKAEVKKLANFFKQAIEDAKKAVEEEKDIALAEIESAKAAVQRVEMALQEQELLPGSTEKLEFEDLKKEIQDARRIKMLHQPSKVMDMEHELRALRIHLAEKSSQCIQLKKELAMIRRRQENVSDLYDLEGSESLGSCLRIIPRLDSSPNISNCSIQWYRVSTNGTKDMISGAIKEDYAPEPFDVGRLLQAEIYFHNQSITVTTSGPIDPAAGLESYVEALSKRTETEFNVVVIKMNGKDYSSKTIHVLHVGKMQMKLCKRKSTKAKESYSSSMQLCGARGSGDAAAQTVFWQAKKGLSYALAFESYRERNAAIMLSRRYASDCDIMLGGPDDKPPIAV